MGFQSSNIVGDLVFTLPSEIVEEIERAIAPTRTRRHRVVAVQAFIVETLGKRLDDIMYRDLDAAAEALAAAGDFFDPDAQG